MSSRFPGLEHLTTPGRVVLATEYYDGPISGIFETLEPTPRLFWFTWLSEAEDNARVFHLREIPPAHQPPWRVWLQTQNDLHDEYRLVANPHIFPVSEWQKKQLRPLPFIVRQIEIHQTHRPSFESLPVTAWMFESGRDFAALETITVTVAESIDLEAWQRRVAGALRDEDQPQLDRLFQESPSLVTKDDLFLVRLENGARVIIRDHRGQKLPDDFWMTARHRIQDLTHHLTLQNI